MLTTRYPKFLFAVFIALMFLVPLQAQAGWKTKAIIATGGVIAGQAVKKCIVRTCPKVVMEKIDDYLLKHPEYRQHLVSKFQEIAVNNYPHLLKTARAKERYRNMLAHLRGDARRKSGVPGDDFKIHPSVEKPYKRPSEAGPVKLQTNSVQGKPCADCGEITPKQVADHKDPLVVEYYRDGKINIMKQRSDKAIQPHCPTCSRQQGGQLGSFGKKMKKLIKGEKQ